MSQFPAIHGRLRFAAPATRRQPLPPVCVRHVREAFCQGDAGWSFSAPPVRNPPVPIPELPVVAVPAAAGRLCPVGTTMAFPGVPPGGNLSGSRTSWLLGAGIPLGAQEPRTPGDLGEPAAPQGYLAVGELPDQSPALAGASGCCLRRPWRRAPCSCLRAPCASLVYSKSHSSMVGLVRSGPVRRRSH